MNKFYASHFLLSVGLLFSYSMVLADDEAVTSEASQINEKAVAIQALTNMSGYLRGLDKFSIKAMLYTDEVMKNGQKIQLTKTVKIKADPPSRFWAKASSMYNKREFFYDGKTFTLSSPLLGYYASFDAPDTIGQTLSKAEQEFSINLPLADLFYWGSEAGSTADIDEAIIVGIDKVNGISCNQFAYRQQDIDWQICIQRGDTPVPLKLVINSKQEKAQPQYMALLKWDTAPALKKQLFTFTPGSSDHKINFTKVTIEK